MTISKESAFVFKIMGSLPVELGFTHHDIRALKVLIVQEWEDLIFQEWVACLAHFAPVLTAAFEVFTDLSTCPDCMADLAGGEEHCEIYEMEGPMQRACRFAKLRDLLIASRPVPA